MAYLAIHPVREISWKLYSSGNGFLGVEIGRYDFLEGFRFFDAIIQ